MGPSPFRLKYLEPYAEAARTWLHDEAEVIDTSHITPDQAAALIASALTRALVGQVRSTPVPGPSRQEGHPVSVRSRRLGRVQRAFAPTRREEGVR